MGIDCSNQLKCYLKALVAAIIMAAVGILIGWFLWTIIFSDVWTADKYLKLWRPLTAPEWQLMPTFYILYSIFFVFVYSKYAYNKTCPSGTKFGGGAIFGFHLWFITGLSPAIAMYISMPVSFDMAIIMPVENLLFNMFGGGFAAYILTHSRENEASESTSK
mgnify:CR=1 FL=1